MGDCSLASIYHHLFTICTVPEVSVHDVIVSSGLVLQFKRQLTGVLFIEFNELCGLIS